MSRVDVLTAGLLTTVQDLGRPGFAHLGVPPSGAADRPSLELGNALVGNPPAAAALEATLVGPRLRFTEPALVAITGAETALGHGVIRVGAGEILDVGPCRRGTRVYICVAGGFEAPEVLGSRSTDLMSGLGPPPLRDGDVLATGAAPPEPSAVDLVAGPLPEAPVLRLLLGPRDDWLTAAALDTLVNAEWTVANASNRIGVRLEGPELERARSGELPSEGVVTGSLQVPPPGRPIVLLNDHPTTGGYPVAGVVDSRDLPIAGQLRPGDVVRFTTVPA